MTQLQLDTVFAMIANDLNNMPMCRTDNSNAKSRMFEVITPNRLLLGRNNFRSLYLDVKLDDTTLPSQILSNNTKLFSVLRHSSIICTISEVDSQGSGRRATRGFLLWGTS